MTDDIETLFKTARKATLSPVERSTMREALRTFVREHPATAPLSIRIVDIFSRLAPTGGNGFRAPLAAAFALVLVVGIGTSYAAESALPGSPLYLVKVGLNERIEGAFAVSEASRAEWNTERIERRLTEAETLIAAGTFDVSHRALLQSEMTRAAVDFDASVVALEREKESEVALASVQSKLEASLDAHAAVLSTLAVQAPEMSAAAGPIIVKAKTKAATLAVDRARAEARIAVRTDEPVAQAARTMKQEVSRAAEDVKAKAASARAIAPATALAASTTVENATDAVAATEGEMQAGAYGQAYGALQAASRALDEAEVHIEAATRLKTEIVPPPAPQDRDESGVVHGTTFQIIFR